VAQVLSFWLEFKAYFQSAFGWIAKNATVSNLVALTWIGLSVVICVLIVREVIRDVVTIEAISVPKALADSGYTPEVASHRLRDALNSYASQNRIGPFVDEKNLKSNQDLNIAARDELPDFVVPQIGLSLNAIVSSIRSVLHYRTGPAISGEVIMRDKYALRVRVDGREVFSSGFDAENPDDLMIKAAPAITEIIKPSVNAIVLYRDHRQQSLLKAEDIIARYDEQDLNVQMAYMVQGNHALDTQNYADAEAKFRKAITLHWSNPQPHIQLGVALQRQGKIDDAIVQFNRVISIDPKSATAYNSIGIALIGKATADGKLDDAILAYRQAIEADPLYPLSYNNLGLALSRQGHVDQAIAQYRLAIEVDPKYTYAHWNLAFALRSQRNFDGAIAEYRVAISCTKATRDLARLHTDVADVLRLKAGPAGDLDDAVAEYQQAIRIDPAYTWAHNNLGVIWRNHGKIDDAIAEFHSAVEADPKNATAKENLAQAQKMKDAGAATETVVSKE
jgi:tetratricopeptide (TPR) repeat protein